MSEEEVETIQFHRAGSLVQAFPTDTYSLNIMAGIPCVMEKNTRKVVFVPSPQYYDYIEIGV